MSIANGSNEVLFAFRGRLHVLELRRQRTARSGHATCLRGREDDPFKGGPAAGDVDGDGRLEIVAADQIRDGVMCGRPTGRCSPDGRVSWHLGVRPSVSVDDLGDGDGRAEIVVAGPERRRAWIRRIHPSRLASDRPAGSARLRPPAIGDVTAAYGAWEGHHVVRDYGNAFDRAVAVWDHRSDLDRPGRAVQRSSTRRTRARRSGQRTACWTSVTGTNLGQVFAWRGQRRQVVSGWPATGVVRGGRYAFRSATSTATACRRSLRAPERDASGTSRLCLSGRGAAACLPGWPSLVSCRGGGPQYWLRRAGASSTWTATARPTRDRLGRADTGRSRGSASRHSRFDAAKRGRLSAAHGEPRPARFEQPGRGRTSTATGGCSRDGVVRHGRPAVRMEPAGTLYRRRAVADVSRGCGSTPAARLHPTERLASSRIPADRIPASKRQPIVFDGSASTVSGGGGPRPLPLGLPGDGACAARLAVRAAPTRLPASSR